MPIHPMFVLNFTTETGRRGQKAWGRGMMISERAVLLL